MKGEKRMKKNVVVKQADLKDCGACCLLSIIKYFDGYVPLETILQDTHTTRNGTTAFNLIKAAQKYGMDASGFKIEDQALETITLPAIAHLQVDNQFNHFVVIYEINPTKHTLTIMDPAKGLKTITYEEFTKAWTKIIIMFIPNSKLPKLSKPKNILNLLFNLIPSEKKIISKLLFTSLIFSIISIITSFFFKIALNEVNNNNLRTLILVICLFNFLTIIKVILNYLRDYYESFLNKNIDLKVMIPFLNHLFFLPLNVVSNRTSGEIITRIGEINDLKDLFSKVFVSIFLDLLLSICASIVLFNINKQLFFLLLLICFIYVGVGLFYSPLIYRKVEENIELESAFNDAVLEKVDSFLTLKNIHRFDMLKKTIEYKYCRYLKNTLNLNHLIINNNLLKNLISEIGLSLITSLGCYYILKANFTLIDLITFNSLLLYMFDPLKNIINLLPRFNYLKASFNKVSEFLCLNEENLTSYPQRFLNGDIKFENLKFSYNDYNFVVDNFNAYIKRGTKVMFKGRSGCGKSTICKLLYRLYDYQEGAIKINRVNILDYNLNTLRGNITYLAQKESIFNDTIYNNIVLDRSVSTSWFNKIVEICHLEDIVKQKPLRYETVISNNLANLSGGERQRIILARALLKKSYILVLDEALSEVETELERDIIKDIFTTFKDKTIIYVTHKDNDDLFDQVINFTEVSHNELL